MRADMTCVAYRDAMVRYDRAVVGLTLLGSIRSSMSVESEVRNARNKGRQRQLFGLDSVIPKRVQDRKQIGVDVQQASSLAQVSAFPSPRRKSHSCVAGAMRLGGFKMQPDGGRRCFGR